MPVGCDIVDDDVADLVGCWPLPSGNVAASMIAAGAVGRERDVVLAAVARLRHDDLAGVHLVVQRKLVFVAVEGLPLPVAQRVLRGDRLPSENVFAAVGGLRDREVAERVDVVQPAEGDRAAALSPGVAGWPTLISESPPPVPRSGCCTGLCTNVRLLSGLTLLGDPPEVAAQPSWGGDVGGRLAVAGTRMLGSAPPPASSIGGLKVAAGIAAVAGIDADKPAASSAPAASRPVVVRRDISPDSTSGPPDLPTWAGGA